MDLKSYLKGAGRTQTDFAGEVGTTVATISRLISGSLRPSLNLAHEIERASKGAVPTETWVVARSAPEPELARVA